MHSPVWALPSVCNMIQRNKVKIKQSQQGLCSSLQPPPHTFSPFNWNPPKLKSNFLLSLSIFLDHIFFRCVLSSHEMDKFPPFYDLSITKFPPFLFCERPNRQKSSIDYFMFYRFDRKIWLIFARLHLPYEFIHIYLANMFFLLSTVKTPTWTQNMCIFWLQIVPFPFQIMPCFPVETWLFMICV